MLYLLRRFSLLGGGGGSRGPWHKPWARASSSLAAHLRTDTRARRRPPGLPLSVGGRQEQLGLSRGQRMEGSGSWRLHLGERVTEGLGLVPALVAAQATTSFPPHRGACPGSGGLFSVSLRAGGELKQGSPRAALPRERNDTPALQRKLLAAEALPSDSSPRSTKLPRTATFTSTPGKKSTV